MPMRRADARPKSRNRREVPVDAPFRICPRRIPVGANRVSAAE